MSQARLTRGRLTWYCYLLSGFFTIILNIQGNIIPFLRDELGLSYREAGLHPSAIAVGMIVSGLTTERVLAALGRRRALMLAVGGSLLGLLLLGVAPSAHVSVFGCLLVGLTGAMIPGIIAGLLAQLHGAARDQAYAECGAVTYLCVMAGNLAVGGTVSAGLGWRAALLLGAALGVAIVLGLGRGPIPDPPPRAAAAAAGAVPAAAVVFLITLGLGVALEYVAVLWTPAFLESVVGFGRSQAAAWAATFALAMLIGRYAGSVVVRRVPPPVLYPAALSLIVPGFLLYWLVATPVAAVAGLFVIGLAIALLYPLSLGFAIAAAGARADAVGTRSAFAAGSALLLSPLILGGLADTLGLRAAHLAIPALAVAILAALAVGRALDRRARPYRRLKVGPA